MNTHSVQALVVALAVVGALALFGVYALKTSQEQGQLSAQAATSVAAKHFYENGVHIYAGSITLPTPCHRLHARALSDDSSEVTLMFESEEVAEDCMSEPNEQTFFVSFKGEATLRPNARLNGEQVELDVVSVDSDTALLP